MGNSGFKPFVLGAPRSGFALLSSVVIHFIPYAHRSEDLRLDILRALLKGLGDHVSKAIVECFGKHGVTDDLLFNPNFRYLAGGPKWIPRDRPDVACFRKYIGLKGKGDFTLVTSHPREVLNLDEVVHSHTDPGLWLNHQGYGDYTKYASVRNPADILNSSVFSLNALASEYIQKFVPPEMDNDEIRQELALYKFTDLDFFEGLVKFLAGYFEEFMEVNDRYILMRWEDLISDPVRTISRLAEESGVSISRRFAEDIWRKLDHVNLTQAHQHNFRVGHGIVGGWKNWITNHHLEMVRSYGFERHMIKLGYGAIELLDESRYTPFQKKVSEYIDSGKVYRNFFDEDLFTFAFNKSNLDSRKFPFKRYQWRENTQVERSIFVDEALQNDVWDCAERACGELNALIEDYLESSKGLESRRLKSVLRRLKREHKCTLGKRSDVEYEAVFQAAHAMLSGESAQDGVWQRLRGLLTRNSSLSTDTQQPSVRTVAPPRLVSSETTYNVVEYNGQYYALPHALGPTDLESQKVEGLPGVLITTSLREALVHAGGGDPEIQEKKDSRQDEVLFNRQLSFFTPTLQGGLDALAPFAGRRVVFCIWNEFARELVAEAGEGAEFAVLRDREGAESSVLDIIESLDFDDVLLLNEFNAERLSSLMMDYLDAKYINILAPETERYCKNRPLFLVSIPKGGTHLLYRLAGAMGYGAAVVHKGNPAAGNWYCLEYSNSHTVARDFFIDSVRRQPFGNRHHPFLRTPVLFIYRNPLDVLVSEANYYHKDGSTLFSPYLSGLSFEQRLMRLIDDRYLLGSIRERINNFVPWFECENVIPVSFEELIGDDGGGSNNVRNDLIWSLQLKLHVPGVPEELGASIFDESSPTFHEGRIGSSRQKMTADALDRFFALEQDFMMLTGYSSGDVSRSQNLWDRVHAMPIRRDEFRRRHLRTSAEDFRDVPFSVEWDFLRHNIIRYAGVYFAVAIEEGAVDLVKLQSERLLDRLLSSPDLDELKELIRNRSE